MKKNGRRMGSRLVSASSLAVATLALASPSTAAKAPPKIVARSGPTQIISVKTLPSSTLLKRGVLNTVAVKPDLAFKITVRNKSGAARNVVVRLTIRRPHAPAGPIVKLATLHLARAQSKAATFGNLGQMMFAVRTNLKVDVETNLGKVRGTGKVVRQVGTVVYPVIFALG
jgi:hypothetical protein